MDTHNQLNRAMNTLEEEGTAPIQTLGHTTAAMLPNTRDVDRLYPAKFQDTRDQEKESKMALKLQLPQNVFGTRTLEADTVDYMYDKAKQQEMRNFDAWYATIFDHNDPAQLKLSREINPGWFQRRISAIDQSLEFQKKIAKMNLMGIRNQEDVLTAYAIATGRVEPALYQTNFMRPEPQTDAVRTRQYIKGMFAPRLFDQYATAPLRIKSATQPLMTPTEGLIQTPGGPMLHQGDFTSMMTGESHFPPSAGGLNTAGLNYGNIPMSGPQTYDVAPDGNSAQYRAFRTNAYQRLTGATAAQQGAMLRQAGMVDARGQPVNVNAAADLTPGFVRLFGRPN